LTIQQKYFKTIFCDEPLLTVACYKLWNCTILFCNISFFRFLNMDLCAINYTLHKRKTTLVLEACNNFQKHFIAWPSNLNLKHNINTNNKFVQDHVHKLFANCKHFVTLKVINSMNELVKRSYNFDANKNCALVITKQHNNKQMQ
jgi:hypothetical protein